MNGRGHQVGPTLDELRQAGIDAHLARIKAPLLKELSSTWRGRLVWRLACWRARRRR